MGLPSASKLITLYRLLPEGVAAPSAWLRTQGFSRQLVRKYVHSGWLEALAHGVFARPHQPIDPDGIILGLQRLGGAPLHVGGLSALNRQGHAHYLPLGFEAAIHLWGLKPAPAWVTAIPLRERFIVHGTHLFESRANAVGLVHLPTRVRDWTETASGLERAIMELLSLVDESESSFVHAAELFEGLTVLRPHILNELLAGCRSVKVKRLFLFLGARYQYPWFKKLDRSAIDVGRGKRLIVRGGRYNNEFRITVPERFGAER